MMIILIGSLALLYASNKELIEGEVLSFVDIKDVAFQKDQATIKRVIDGDTVVVTLENGQEETIRLLLIDTPESVHPTKEKELFGEEASEYATSILRKGDVITLEIGEVERDKYDRLLAYIWIDDVNFNQLMIEKGYARVAYVFEPNTKYLREFKRAEKRAVKQGENIWSVEGYVTDDGFDMSVVP